ncbi:hypothetical protein [Delftia sp. WSY_14]|uniref:hypothetical protein n=1 Tax=unclassified Delftia TaxID=2613839 RepID=UPI00370C7C48
MSEEFNGILQALVQGDSDSIHIAGVQNQVINDLFRVGVVSPRRKEFTPDLQQPRYCKIESGVLTLTLPRHNKTAMRKRTGLNFARIAGFRYYKHVLHGRIYMSD